VNKAADILGLKPLLERYPRQLSGGQRQRVAMGRAIVRDPAVFLFDEPLSNLDAKLRVQMRAEIKALQQRLASTTIYVTHDQIEAMTMADKIVVMHDGAVEQIGSPLELYDSPANLFVAGFIGSPAMNFINGRLEGGEPPTLVTASGFRVPLGAAPRASIGSEVVLGVRPEHMRLGGSPSVPAELVVVEPTGYETQVIARLDGREIACVLRERFMGRPGESIALSLDGGPLHFFDAETGQAILGR
jgi:multiple sugar transport system ATP-binding protein